MPARLTVDQIKAIAEVYNQPNTRKAAIAAVAAEFGYHELAVPQTMARIAKRGIEVRSFDDAWHPTEEDQRLMRDSSIPSSSVANKLNKKLNQVRVWRRRHGVILRNELYYSEESLQQFAVIWNRCDSAKDALSELLPRCRSTSRYGLQVIVCKWRRRGYAFRDFRKTPQQRAPRKSRKD